MTSAVLYTLFPAAATVIGAAMALYRRPGAATMRVIHHFTAGIVFAAAATEILPDPSNSRLWPCCWAALRGAVNAAG